MGRKGEIGWKRRNEAGEPVQVYAHQVGREWRFFIRQRRYERWEPLDPPTLKDWHCLLDAVERRVTRRLQPPEELERIRKRIAELFPEERLDV